ncbi:hypothetical protein FB451DRAFT_1221663 [Mycena latifolia]|nr:hypothetical protein FB451DRAFT_1221663 [Mycena latifolia]
MARRAATSTTNTTLMASIPTFHFDSTLGAFQIGVVVSSVLFGVTTTQTYTYYGRFPEDSRGLKCLVALIWLCEVAHLICIEATQYQYTVSNFGRPEDFLFMPRTMIITMLLSAAIGAGVQTFFSLRIYKLSKNLYISAFSWALSFSRIVFTIVGAVYGSEHNLLLMTYWQQHAWIFYILWVGSMMNDLIIAGTLVYWLYRQRVGGHMRSDALVDKLITWTLETGVITSAGTLVTAILFVAMKDNYIWVAFYIVTAKLYANSLLASLNSRATLRAMNEVSIPNSFLAFQTPVNIEMSKVSRVVD